VSKPESLRVEKLAKRIAAFTLEADFVLEAGERLAVQAPSGAGKSTLLRLLAGLESPDSGRILLGGQDITQLAPPERGIGIVFQDAALFDSMSVAENAAFGLRVRGVGKQDRLKQAAEWLGRVGLGERGGEAVHHLSGGEKQRVAFVRALIWKPRLLLLDEPFSALDRDLRADLRRTLLDLHREWPVPMLLVTHDREDVDALATRSCSIAETSPRVRVLQQQSG
jgi:putative spermidine/putrescine transport system ATP-binding protein